MIEYTEDFSKTFHQLCETGFVLLAFYAPWCGTCRSVFRMLQSAEGLELFPIVRIDGDHYRDLMNEYDVVGVPTLILTDHHQTCLKIGGSVNFMEFKEWLRSCDTFKELP